MTRTSSNLVDWFDHSAAEFRDRVAIEDCSGRSIRYGELAEVSRAVQANLVQTGIRHGDRVGIFMKKSIDTLIAFQVILRTGAVYVPTDPQAPASRAALMLHDCEAVAIIVDAESAERLKAELGKLGILPRMLVVPASPPEGHSWRIEALRTDASVEDVPRNGSDLAFMLYTSGSTGQPKAVMLSHENVVAFINWCSEVFAPKQHDKFAVHSPPHFSLPVFQLYLAWKHGATVVLIDDAVAKNPDLLGPAMERSRITVWFSTPTIFSLLAESGQLQSLNLESLRLVMFGGEPLSAAKLRVLKAQLPHPRYIHILGSTETHIMAYHDLAAIDSNSAEPLPVGRVCNHFRNRILDDSGGDASIGTDGELCLNGPAVAVGYWKAPEAMARAFFTDDAGRRWYRTGDIVRLQPNGDLIYRGRRDRMVKKHGNRIELREIEICLGAHATVNEVAVIAVPHEELGVKVTAFVVPCHRDRPTVIKLKAHCADSLPPYMIPDAFTFLEALPRTSTGKIDFSSLHVLAEAALKHGAIPSRVAH